MSDLRQPDGSSRGPIGGGWPEDDRLAGNSARVSAVNRIWKVLVSPRETFEAISARPSWGLAMLLSFVVVAGLWVFLVQKIDFLEIMKQQLAEQGKEVPPGAEKFVQVQKVMTPVIVGIVTILLPLIIAAVMLVLNLFGGKLRYAVSLSVVLHSGIPLLLKALLTLPVVYARGGLTLAEAQSGVLRSNLAAFASEDTSPRLLVLLASVDVFSIWWIGLMILGFGVAAKVSKGKAAALVLSGWAVMLLLSVFFAGLRPS